MGLVVRKGLIASFFVYGGLLLGYLSTLVIFPKFLDVKEIGLLRLIQTNGLMLAPFVSIGMPSVWIKVFPSIKGDRFQQSQFFTFQIAVIVVANLLLIAGIYLFRNLVFDFFKQNSQEYIPYIFVSVIILFTQSIFNITAAAFKGYLNVSTPGYFNEVHLRVVNLVLVILYGTGIISFKLVLILFGTNYFFTTFIFCIILILKYNIRPTFSFLQISSRLKNESIRYGAYFSILAMGFAISANIGSVLTSKYLGLVENGIFTTCLYLALIIEMPRRASLEVLTPLISQYFEEGSHSKLQEIYTKASINLAILGALLFIGITTNIKDLFAIVPQGDVFINGLYFILITGVSKVMLMFFGCGNEIFTFSPYKRYNILLMLFNTITMVIGNVILIPKYGLIGAGFAFLITALFNNLIRFFWILVKMKMNPFNINHIILLFISAIIFSIFWHMPFGFSPVINILLRSVSILGVFTLSVHLTNISNEFNELLINCISTFRNMIK